MNRRTNTCFRPRQARARANATLNSSIKPNHHPAFGLICPNSIPIRRDRSASFSRAVAATSPILHQAGVIAYRIQNGKVRVLLMTSRDTGRWIIPRGNLKRGVTPCRAAEQEAYEEAGVRGTNREYTCSKKLASGEPAPQRSRSISFVSRSGSRNGLKGANEGCPGYRSRRRSGSSKSLEWCPCSGS
jgi:NUDIX domain-containing protein